MEIQILHMRLASGMPVDTKYDKKFCIKIRNLFFSGLRLSYNKKKFEINLFSYFLYRRKYIPNTWSLPFYDQNTASTVFRFK